MKQSTLAKCKEYEYQILESLDISRYQCLVDEIYLTEKRYIHYVQINAVKMTKNNVLLMAHGYLGSNIGFYKMYQALKDHFHIISIDLPGQGLSSSEKNKDLPKSCEGWRNYFVHNISAFLEKIGVEKVNILGHSMGSWVLTHFLKLYPDKVQKVFLLSPGGMHHENEQFTNRITEFKKTRPWYMKMVANSVLSKTFKNKNGPLDYWFLWGLKGYIAKKIYTGNRLGLSKEHQKFFVPLYQEIFKSNPSSNKCLGYVFNEGPMSDLPLMPIFEEFSKSKEINLYFGRHDWMDYQLTQQIVEEKDLNIKIQFIENCDHQIVFQNPLGAAEAVLNDFYFEIEEENEEANEEPTEKLEIQENPENKREFKENLKLRKQKFEKADNYGGFEKD